MSNLPSKDNHPPRRSGELYGSESGNEVPTSSPHVHIYVGHHLRGNYPELKDIGKGYSGCLPQDLVESDYLVVIGAELFAMNRDENGGYPVNTLVNLVHSPEGGAETRHHPIDLVSFPMFSLISHVCRFLGKPRICCFS